jgi:hypothetical protein
VPAAAVIPAPIAYIKIVAVKKLVVGFLVRRTWPVSVYGIVCRCAPSILRENTSTLHWAGVLSRSFTLKKLECLKQACAMNTLAWNNNLGLWSYFVGF